MGKNSERLSILHTFRVVMNTLILTLYRAVVKFIPETKGFAFKRWMLRRAGATVGRNVRICSSVFIAGAGNLSIGDDSWVGHRSTIIASGDMRIGKNVDIAPCVLITTGSHRPEPQSDRMAGEGIGLNVEVQDGCWICANATILPGITVGEMSLVAAGAVVNRNVEPRTLVAGVPARLVKDYNHSN